MRPVVAHADAAAMRHNDRAAEREPYTHAAAAIGRLMAGGIEQIEYMGPVSRGDTAAVIRDLDGHPAAFAPLYDRRRSSRPPSLGL